MSHANYTRLHMKIAIDNPLRNLSKLPDNHRTSWSYLWRELLINEGHQVDVMHDWQPWDDYDAVYFDMGMEYTGTGYINLFDGLTEKVYRRMNMILEGEGKYQYRCLDWNMPTMGEKLKVRVRNDTAISYEKCTLEWCDELIRVCGGIKKFGQEHLTPMDGITIGDSHSFSVWQPGNYCKRIDARTLRNLSQTVKAEAAEFVENPKRLTFYAGNIDLRHHAFRREDPKGWMFESLHRLERTLLDWGVPEVELVYLLPVEDESRKMRKSIMFEGANFFGSREDRAKLCREFNDEMDRVAARNGWSVYRWPAEWYDETDRDPKWFFERMEKPYSVHLSRRFYRWKPSPPQVGVLAEVFGF